MAITKSQKDEFQKYVKDNNIDTNKLTNDHAKEFLSKGSFGFEGITLPEGKAPDTKPGAIPGIVPEEKSPEITNETNTNETTNETTTPETTHPEATNETNTSETTNETTTPETTPKTTPETTTTTPNTEPGAIPDVVPEEIKSEKQLIAEQEGFNFNKNDNGTITFKPQNLDEALSLFDKFGKNVNIDKSSKEYGTAQRIYDTYSKYKGAPQDIYLEGFKNGDIGVGGETWDRLVSMNGGEPTAEMLAAQKEYDDILKLDNINQTSSIISGEEIEDSGVTLDTKLGKLDEAYIKKINSLFGDITKEWNNYKKGSDKMESLNDNMRETASSIDELVVEKRKVLDNLKKRYPNLPLSQRLVLADEEISAIDDQLFVLQRQQNNDLSAYKFESEKIKGDFEFKQTQIQTQMDMVSTMYGDTRGDIIRQADIERQDTLLADQIKTAEKARKDAIVAKDAEMAKEQSYKLAFLKEQSKLNKSASDSIINLGGNSYLEYNTETKKWDLQSGQIEGNNESTTTIPTSTVTPTGKITQIDFTTPGGANKILKIDESAQSSLQSLIKQFQLEVPGGDSIVIGDTFRSNEEQAALYKKYQAGEMGLVAKPGTSKHETGLAIDIYSNSNLDPLTTEQVAVMNQNGWYQTAGVNDKGHFEYMGKQEQTTGKEGLTNFNNLNNVDKLNAINYISAKNRAGYDPTKEGKTPDNIKSAGNELINAVNYIKTQNPDLVNMFDILSKGGSKLSNEEGANIQKAEIEFALDGNKQKFIDQIRNLAQKSILGEDVDIKNVKKNIIQLDRTADLLTSMDSNKWNSIQKELGDMAGVSTREDFDKAKTRLGLEASAFVKEISGAAVTDEEFQRLSSLLPSLGDTPELALNKLAEFRRTRFETLTEPAISLLGDKEDVFYQLYPELKGGEVYTPPKDGLDDFIDDVSNNQNYGTTENTINTVNNLYPKIN